MNKELVKVRIDQEGENTFNIKLVGNYEDLLKSLAGAVAQAVLTAPESYQQHCRTRFLQYLNQATIESHMEDL